MTRMMGLYRSVCDLRQISQYFLPGSVLISLLLLLRKRLKCRVPMI
jgi:hypothetical protein